MAKVKIFLFCLMAFVPLSLAGFIDLGEDEPEPEELSDPDPVRYQPSKYDDLWYSDPPREKSSKVRYVGESSFGNSRRKRQVFGGYGGVSERIRELEYELESLERNVGFGNRYHGRDRYLGRGFGHGHEYRQYDRF